MKSGPASLAKFIYAIRKMNIEEYKGRYLHKLALKAPYVKTGKNLLFDLEHVKILFQNSNLSVVDIEKEIRKIVTT